MSQIASFTYLRSSDVPLIGFWSKPKARLFKLPSSQFFEFISKHANRRLIFDSGDGLYIALVFAWLTKNVPSFEDEVDLVLNTVRKHTGNSCWLFSYRDKFIAEYLGNALSDKEWIDFQHDIVPEMRNDLLKDRFQTASTFVKRSIEELQRDEALLVWVG